jgi:hypothetical protein
VILRLLAVLVALAVPAGAVAAVAPAPKPKTGAAPWPAPKDPMQRTRLARLVPETSEHLAYHVHSHLDVFLNGKRILVPAGIGIDTKSKAVQHGPGPDGNTAYGGITQCPRVCISPLHTHATTGVLHTETARPVPNELGQFFVEWGVRLDKRCIGGYCKPDSIAIYVNGKRYTEDPRLIPLANRTEIAIVIGTPPRTIPTKWTGPAF